MSGIDRVKQSLMPELDASCAYTFMCFEKVCESPIEVMLGTALVALSQIDPWTCGPRIIGCKPDEVDHYDPQSVLLICQYPFEHYRVDFALRVPQYRFGHVLIECDGHNFHKRTKEQAKRDREKDRLIQQLGKPILRFTGSEIFRDPAACARQVFDFLDGRIDDYNPQGAPG